MEERVCNEVVEEQCKTVNEKVCEQVLEEECELQEEEVSSVYSKDIFASFTNLFKTWGVWHGGRGEVLHGEGEGVRPGEEGAV